MFMLREVGWDCYWLMRCRSIRGVVELSPESRMWVRWGLRGYTSGSHVLSPKRKLRVDTWGTDGLGDGDGDSDVPSLPTAEKNKAKQTNLG
jgi:hypothetical protein